MSTALARIADATGFDRTKIELVKDTVAKGASDDELMLFLSLAHRSGLDPFSRQIYLIERRQKVQDGDRDKWITTRQPQTGIDGLRLIADRTGNYAPGRAPTYEYTAEGRLRSATAYVMKFVRGQWHEVAATAHYDEYVQAKRDGSPTQMWADKPHIMLAKCAEALALRRAFPADMSGLYTSDEIRDEPAATLVEAPRPMARPALPAAPAADVATGEVVDERQRLIDQVIVLGKQMSDRKLWINDGEKPRMGELRRMELDDLQSLVTTYQERLTEGATFDAVVDAVEQEAAPAAA